MALNFPNPATQTPVNEFSPTSTPASTDNGVVYTWTGNKWSAAGSGGGGGGGGDYLPISGGELTGDLTVPSLNGSQLAGFRNQLINGGMVVHQRLNPSATPTSKWVTDRWSNDSFAQLSAREVFGPLPPGANNSIELTMSGTAGVLTQPVEVTGALNGQFPVGSTWTLSWWTTNVNDQCNCYWFDSNSTVSLVSWTKVGSIQTVETSGTFTRLAQTFTAVTRTNPGHTQLNVEFGTSAASGTVQLTNAQLEPGPVTPFEHRPIATELALCQRYYQHISRNPSANGDYPQWSGVRGVAATWSGAVTDHGSFTVQLSPEMRISPTVSIVGARSHDLNDANNALYVSRTPYGAGAINTQFVGFAFNSLPTNYTLDYQYIIADAEL
jgi:hypothetical protein